MPEQGDEVAASKAIIVNPSTSLRSVQGIKALLPERGLMPESKAKRMKSQWHWYVYIVECVDGFYYTGITWKPDLRWIQHLSGIGSKFTSKHKPKKVAYLEEYDNLKEARRREKQIKGWTRKKKEKLIKGVWGKW